MTAPPDYRQCLQPLPMAWQAPPRQRAAVLAPIVAVAGGDALLFTVRCRDLRRHAGQISFPGGIAAGDAAPMQCALREAHEEVGLEPDAVQLLGHLGVRASSSGYLVHCVVGRVLPGAQLQPAPGEVERLLTVPLPELADLARWQLRAPPPASGGRPPRPSPHFTCGDDVIWGLTGRFAHDFALALARR